MGNFGKGLLVAVTSICVGLYIAVLLLDKETTSVVDARTVGPVHTVVDFPSGKTHLEIQGPEEKQLVILVHGASGPMAIWDQVMPSLAKNSRVLRYDLFGRGLSDRAKGKYDLDLYVTQLEGIIAKYSPDRNVQLVGSSMGAIIATAYTIANPSKVDKIVLIGPAGFPIGATSASKLMDYLIFGEIAMKLFGDKALVEHNTNYYSNPDKHKDSIDIFAKQLRTKGTKYAILSTMREVPMQDYKARYSNLGGLGKPVLLLWGEHDITFPYSNNSFMLEAIGGVEFERIPDSGHMPQLENPELVVSALERFLTSY